MGEKSPETVEVSFGLSGKTVPLLVLGMRGQDGISMLYTLEIELASSNSGLPLEEMVGSAATLTMKGAGGTRCFNGLINEFQQLTTQKNGYTQYRATLVPAVWRLLQNSDCRIFQKQDAKKIVTGILNKAKIQHTFRARGNRALVERDYCVQYRESDWAFICRLLEEEGFFYFFEHTADGHMLHIGDSPDFFIDLPGTASLPLHAADAMVPGEEQITSFNFKQRLCPDTSTLNDFNFERPTVSLAAQKIAGKAGTLEQYDFPGGYRSAQEAKHLVGVRLEEAQTPGKIGEAWSNCPRISGGFSFQLTGHPSKAYDRKEYVASMVLHQLEKSASDHDASTLVSKCSYMNSFRCITAGTPYRPPRLTPRPVVQGAQTAFVVGPDNEEIYTDKHGRVKVQFHWDREGKMNASSSCWVRVSQLWAGQGWGAIWIPRIGQEVLVDFLEGDPDRPIITGRVYNGINPPPYDLPADKTRSAIKSSSTPGGKGYNEIRFEDKKGAEELYTHAQRNRTEVVRNEMSTSVGGGQSLSVGGARSHTVTGVETVKVKKDQDITVTGMQDVKVKKDQDVTVTGMQSVTVGKDQTVSVTGKQDVTVGGGMTLTISGDEVLRVKGELRETATKGKKIVAKTVTIEVVEAVTIQCGGTTFKLGASGIDLD